MGLVNCIHIRCSHLRGLFIVKKIQRVSVNCVHIRKCLLLRGLFIVKKMQMGPVNCVHIRCSFLRSVHNERFHHTYTGGVRRHLESRRMFFSGDCGMKTAGCSQLTELFQPQNKPFFLFS